MLTASSHFTANRLSGPITQIAIVHHRSEDNRAEIRNNPEMNNEDGIITYVYNKESKDGSSFILHSKVRITVAVSGVGGAGWGEGRESQKWEGWKSVIFKSFAENCMKMKGTGPGVRPLHPLGSANVLYSKRIFHSKLFILNGTTQWTIR